MFGLVCFAATMTTAEEDASSATATTTTHAQSTHHPWLSFLHLDPDEESEDDFHEEQKLVHHAFNDDGSIDEEDLAFPTRAEFRGQGMKRALMNTNRRHTIGHGDSDDILHVEVAKAVIDMDLEDKTDHAANPMKVVTSMGDMTSNPKDKASSTITKMKNDQENGAANK